MSELSSEEDALSGGETGLFELFEARAGEGVSLYGRGEGGWSWNWEWAGAGAGAVGKLPELGCRCMDGVNEGSRKIDWRRWRKRLI